MAVRFIGNVCKSSTIVPTAISLCKPQTPRAITSTQQVSWMRAVYGEKYGYDEAFPYDMKMLSYLNVWHERPSRRWNENTKLVMVEGNMAVGKKKFAEKMAWAFDLKHFDAVNDADCHIEKTYNYDMRRLNEFLPHRMKFFDLELFYNDLEKSGLVYDLQQLMFRTRFRQYMAAKLHALCTGQGTVMTRSPHSDIVFARAMYRMGYISQIAMDHYQEKYDNMICKLWKPHLFIYLDAPVSVIMERVKSRGIPYEVNSPLLNEQYLEVIEDEYKNYMLPRYSKKCEVMTLDWTEYPDDLEYEYLFEDLCSVKLEAENVEDQYFHEWYCPDQDAQYKMIRMLQRGDAQLDRWLGGFFKCDDPAMTPSEDDRQAFLKLREKHFVLQQTYFPPRGTMT